MIIETFKEVILQFVEKSNDCADERYGTLTHKEQLTLFRAIVTFLFTCAGMLEKMIVNTTEHAFVQAFANIEEKSCEDSTVELSIEPAAFKYLFKSKIPIRWKITDEHNNYWFDDSILYWQLFAFFADFQSG